MPPSVESTQELPQERSNTQRQILSKKCQYCERRFSKAEHLKRHQRSHTGERPYRCSRCQKCFSRSDVLIRHLKNHPQIPGEEVGPSSSEGEPGPANVKRRASATSAVGAQMNDTLVSPIQDHHPRPLSPSRIDPALLEPPGEYHDQSEAHAMASGLDHLALLASQEGWGNGPIDTSMTDARNSVMGSGLEPQSWGHEPLPHGHGFGGVLNYQQAGPSSSGSEFHMTAASDGYHGLDFNSDAYSERLESLQNQGPPVLGGVIPNGSLLPPEIMSWFDQFDMDLNNGQDALHHSEFTPAASLNDRQHEALPSDGGLSSITQGSGSVHNLILTERFHKVERCWPNRSSNAICLMPTIWGDAISRSKDNLLSKDNLIPEATEHNKPYRSHWELDEDSRTRLQKIFLNLSRKDVRRDSEGLPPFSYLSPSAQSSATNNVQEESPNIPPPEILNISLDLFLRQYHPLMPFIHTPTFTPKNAPTSILLIMCLIGLTILQTKGAIAFVRLAFPRALEKVCTELLAPPKEGERVDQLTSLSSAILVLSLSETCGNQAHQEQCQMLYTNVITSAQRQGLFSTVNAEPLEEHMLASIPNLDAKWKAWARVESVKRLILCLATVDTWYSAIYQTSPIMRTEDIRMILPCDSSLFQAPTAAKWHQLIVKGAQMCMPTFQMSPDRIVLPELDMTLDPLGMTGILCAVRLRISESYQRLLSGAQQRAVNNSFVPWRAYESDSRAKASKVFTTQIIRAYGSMLSSMNPNCTILWHNLCIMLTTDLRLFELGAGCSGAEAARAALDDISVWTQTPSARRACIHAAQTFKAAFNRRASDGDSFHATTSIFVSALVLGLYILTASPNPEAKLPTALDFDPGDEIDWKAIDNEGLVEESQTGDHPATLFIRDGGPICFNGVMHPPGYESARRIFLDFARLLEDMGKWKADVVQYCKVLRIMCNALGDDDGDS